MNRRTALFAVLAGVPSIFILCLASGASQIGLPDAGTALGRQILFLRLMRLTAGFFVGAALSVSGVILQALLRNPLAEPYVLGVSSGAALGAATMILVGTGVLGTLGVPVAGFVFGCATLAIVYVLARDKGTPNVYSLILSGVIVSATCSSVLMFMISIASDRLHSVIWWMLGNLDVPSVSLLLSCCAFITVGLVAARLLANPLNAITLGEEAAHHLGVRTKVVVVGGLALATLMTASAVGMSGLIGFVGLVVPHVLRNTLGPDHRQLIPASILAGGTFLAFCDAIARIALYPTEIPVGVITALVGGPFFLTILRKRGKHGWFS